MKYPRQLDNKGFYQKNNFFGCTLLFERHEYKLCRCSYCREKLFWFGFKIPKVKHYGWFRFYVKKSRFIYYFRFTVPVQDPRRVLAKFLNHKYGRENVETLWYMLNENPSSPPTDVRLLNIRKSLVPDIRRFLKEDIKEAPLKINTYNYEIRTFARWRLTIGR